VGDALAAPPSSSPRRRSRALGLLLALPLVLIAVYGAFQLFLNTPFAERAIGGPQARVRVAWSSLWMPWPGRFQVRGLRVQSDTRSMQWRLALDQARVKVDLASLLERRFETESVAGRGLLFHLRRKPEAGETVDTTYLPPLPGLELGARAPRPTVRRPPGFRFRLEGIEIEQLREIWVDAYRLTGAGRANGVIDVQIRGPIALEGLTVTLGEGTLLDRGEEVARALDLTTRLDLEPSDQAELRSVAVLRRLDGALRLTAQAGALGFLRPLYQRAGVELGGESRRLDVDLEIERGLLLEGSRFDIADGKLYATFPAIGARGSGSLHGAVASGGLAVRAEIPELELTLPAGSTVGVAKGFALTVESRSASLADLLSPPAAAAAGEAGADGSPADPRERRRERIEATVDRAADAGVILEVGLEDGSVHDLATFTDLFPSGGAFRVTRGAAHLSASARLAVEQGDAKVRVRGSGIGLELMGQPFEADLDVVLDAGSRDPRSRWFDIEEGRLTLSSVLWAGEGGDADWSARLRLRSGRVRLTKPVEVIADVELELTDTRPIIHLLAEEKKSIRWLRALLEIKQVSGTTRLLLDGRSLRLRDLAIDGKGLLVRAQMDVHQPTRALMLVGLHGVHAAVELDHGHRDLNLLHPRRFYDQRAPAWSSGEP
jgi:hypothetical protein